MWRVDGAGLPHAGTGSTIVSPGLEAVLVPQLCDLRLETETPGRSRFLSIERQ